MPRISAKNRVSNRHADQKLPEVGLFLRKSGFGLKSDEVVRFHAPRLKPSMKYTVTHIEDPVRREETLIRLWGASHLHAAEDPRHKYSWFYRDNPLGGATAFFLTEETQGVVGCCGLGTRLVWLDGASCRAGLFADFAVDPAHRTAMPALILQRALCAGAQQRFPLTYGFPNAAAIGIFKRIGFPLLGTMSRYVKVLRHAEFVKRVVPFAPVASVIGAVLDTGVRLREGAAGVFRRGASRLEWLPAPDARFTPCFERARPRYRFISDRSADTLRWRFTERPGRPSEFAALIGPDGDVQAYAAILQKEAGVALIADFLAISDDALGALFDQLIPALRRRGFESAVTFFLGPPSVEGVMRSRGFVLRESAKFVAIGAGEGLSVLPEALTSVKDWYLTEADRDN